MPEESLSKIQAALPHLSRWRSLKQFLPTVLWFIVGVVLAVISTTVLFPTWLRSRIAAMMIQLSWQGPTHMIWMFFAMTVVEWSITILASVVAGMVIKRHVVRDLCSLGLGLALPPLLIYAYDTFKIPEWNFLSERGFIILLTVCCGMLTHYLKCRITRKSRAASSN